LDIIDRFVPGTFILLSPCMPVGWLRWGRTGRVAGTVPLDAARGAAWCRVVRPGADPPVDWAHWPAQFRLGPFAAPW